MKDDVRDYMTKKAKCVLCGGRLADVKTASFQGFTIKARKCTKCGEEYLDPVQAEKILQFNKVISKGYSMIIGKIGSNHLVRFPAKLSKALGLSTGEVVTMKVNNMTEMTIKFKKKR